MDRGFYPGLGSRAADRARAPGTPTVAIGGGNLGVGATTMAALLALATSALGHDTLLVEAQADSLALAPLLGVRLGREVGGRAAGGEGALLPVDDRLTLLRAEPAAGGSALAQRGTLYGQFDIVIVDAGWRLDAVLETCAGEVERVLVVTTGGRSALSSAYGLLKAVDSRFPGTRFDVLANQQEHAAGRHAFEHLHAAALNFLGRGLSLAGVVPEDACLRAGTRGGMSIQDAAAESDVARAVEQVAARLLGELSAPRIAPIHTRHLRGGV